MIYWSLTYFIIQNTLLMGNHSIEHKDKEAHRCQLNHPAFRQASVITQNGVPQLELIYPCPHKQIARNWLDRVKRYRIPPLQSEVILLPKWVKYEQDSLCGTTGLIKARYPSPPLLLIDELQNRNLTMQPFTEPEIWYLLYVLAYSAHSVHSREMVLGDMRPKNIFLFQDGSIAVCCMATFEDQMLGYMKALNFQERAFLAPQQIADLQAKKPGNQNAFISQDFSIGMTLLSLMLLHNQQALYFNEGLLFREHQFKRELQSLANCQIYSKFLRKIVLGLLQSSMNQRLSSSIIYKVLKPYQQKIINLQGFVIIDQMNLKEIETINNISLQSYRRPSRMPSGIKAMDINISRSKLNSIEDQTTILPQQRFASLVITDGHPFDPIFSPAKKNQFQGISSKSIPRESNGARSVGARSKEQHQDSKQTKSNMSSYPNDNHYDEKSDVVAYSTGTPIERLNNDDINRISFNKNEGIFILDEPIPDKKANIPQNNVKVKPVKAPGLKNIIQCQPMSLDSMGRQTKSIKSPPQGKILRNQFEDVLKSIDEQLQRSRQQFPIS